MAALSLLPGALLALGLGPAAHACPTVATGTPNSLTYDVAKTSIVQQNGRTTFTVSINPSGQSQDFALVMPVPALLQESDIAVLDSSVFARLEATTGLLTMADAGCAPMGGTADSAGGDGGDGGGGGGGGGGTVHVEAEYLVGDYQITILSAEESGDLFLWLNTNGYHLADPTIPILEEYIEQGMYFMTAKVSDEATAADGSSLPPLQVGYDSYAMAIPIKLAARNALTQQDMLIYALTDTSEGGGRVGISNYPEFAVPDKCIWGDPAEDDFQAFYEDEFAPRWEAQGGAAWTVEWAGRVGSCSPCSGTSMDQPTLDALGFEGDLADHYLTRIHMRYTPETASADLMLYDSGFDDPKTTSFADDNASNRECIDECGVAATDGSTGGDDGSTPGSTDGSGNSDAAEDGAADKGSGCSSAPGLPLGIGGLAFFGLAAVLRRRD